MSTYERAKFVERMKRAMLADLHAEVGRLVKTWDYGNPDTDLIERTCRNAIDGMRAIEPLNNPGDTER